MNFENDQLGIGTAANVDSTPVRSSSSETARTTEERFGVRKVETRFSGPSLCLPPKPHQTATPVQRVYQQPHQQQLYEPAFKPQYHPAIPAQQQFSQQLMAAQYNSAFPRSPFASYPIAPQCYPLPNYAFQHYPNPYARQRSQPMHNHVPYQ
ncbi:unnamed protein product [Bursaphelenchus okinawaensis]|uniref:Uncharacterized protein n=1 Tax=Bursaphelenchus okinawaensis TaxID=465554 RepID=A0A811LPT4_9BILA|nr:unnamed protein product [Bursaphelenchus okinawaensis]CAG9127699.1 unnamed protein product [Bursaphelenchus okinawaensis]